jgi:hypothetical protein
MNLRQQPVSIERAVIFYTAAALVVLSLLPGCSLMAPEPEQVKVELTQAEQLAALKTRLRDTLVKLQLQKAELKKMIHNDADLELLMRLMYVRQQQETRQNQDGSSLPTQGDIDYLQRMTANQAAIKTDLARLLQDINALTETSEP